MEEPKNPPEENKETEDQTIPVTVTGPTDNTNEATSGDEGVSAPAESDSSSEAAPEETAPEASSTEETAEEPESTVSSPSSVPASEAVDAAPVPNENEPAKLDLAAAAAEAPAEPSVPSPINTQQDAAAPSALAIDNPHPVPPSGGKGLPALLIAVICAVVGVALGFGVAGATGFSLKKEEVKQQTETAQVAVKELKVPADATVINECAKGRGKQYVLPKDIPQGPVYNVYNGKVIGIEYMLSQKDVLANKDYLNLLLEGVAYDHVNVGLLSKGHSGFPDAHYHVDVFTITHEEASKITCT